MGMNTGWPNLADLYNFIVIFPQTSGKGPFQADRISCWNVGWYTNKLEATATGHLTKENPQIVALKKMIDTITGVSGNGGATTTTVAATTTTAATTTASSGVN